MSSLAKMKAELFQLEEKKKLLRAKKAKADKQVKLGLWIIGGGVTLLPLYGTGVILIAAGIIYAFINDLRKTSFQDSLADVEMEINNLEEWMA